MLMNIFRQLRLPKAVHNTVTSMVDLLPTSPKHEKTRRDVEAYCIKCERITLQKAVWVGRIMKGRQCSECGIVTKPDPVILGRCYIGEVLSRAAAKPDSLKNESLGAGLIAAPLRFFTKSLEESRYLGDLILDEREWVDSPHQKAGALHEE